jgi:hypothetical protein
LGRFGQFPYCSKVDAELVELAPLTHKFPKRSCVGIFHTERTRSTPFDPKLMFSDASDRFITARKSMKNWLNWCVRIFHNERTRSTPVDPKLMFWGVSDRFVAARNSTPNWLNWHH